MVGNQVWPSVGKQANHVALGLAWMVVRGAYELPDFAKLNRLPTPRCRMVS
jgi:hypothetical protein